MKKGALLFAILGVAGFAMYKNYASTSEPEFEMIEIDYVNKTGEFRFGKGINDFSLSGAGSFSAGYGGWVMLVEKDDFWDNVVNFNLYKNGTFVKKKNTVMF